MENQYTVLLYSKYSKHSKELIKMIDDSKVDFENLAKLVLVSIDTEEARKRILGSNMEIKHVPCILIIYDDGGVEKYEGNDAFNWVEEIVTKHSPAKPEPVIQPQVVQPVVPEATVIQRVAEPVIQPEPVVQKPPPQSKGNRIHNNRRTELDIDLSHATPIDELGDDYEDEEETNFDNIEMDDIFPPKQASIRSGPGGYELNTEFGKKKSDVKVKNGIKSTSGGGNSGDSSSKKGKSDVMSAALEMQKLREKETENQKPVYG